MLLSSGVGPTGVWYIASSAEVAADVSRCRWPVEGDFPSAGEVDFEVAEDGSGVGSGVPPVEKESS